MCTASARNLSLTTLDSFNFVYSYFYFIHLKLCILFLHLSVFIYYYYIIATETPEFPLLGNQDYLILKSHAIMN